MTTPDLRWLQHFGNHRRALLLDRGVQLALTRGLSELEQQAMIQGFEFTHEPGWNLPRWGRRFCMAPRHRQPPPRLRQRPHPDRSRDQRWNYGGACTRCGVEESVA